MRHRARGRRPVFGEASAWQLARSVVVRSADDRLADLGRTVDPITEARARAERGCRRKRRGPHRTVAPSPAIRRTRRPAVRAARRGAAVRIGSRSRGDLSGSRCSPISPQNSQAAKSRRGLVEYSDQVAFALAIVRAAPRVVEKTIGRAVPVVLLDEYQDTSVVQTWLLASCSPGTGHGGGRPATSRSTAGAVRARPTCRAFPERFDEGEPVESSRSRPAGATGTRSSTPRTRSSRSFAQDPSARLDRGPRSPAGDGASRRSRRPSTTRRSGRRVAEGAARVGRRRQTDRGHAVPQRANRRCSRGARGAGRALPRARHRRAALDAGDRRPGECASVVHDPDGGLRTGPPARRLALAHRPQRPAALTAVRLLAALARLATAAADDEVKQRMRDSVAAGEGGSIVDALDFIAEAPEPRPTRRLHARPDSSGCARPRPSSRCCVRARARPARLRASRRAGAAPRHRGGRQRVFGAGSRQPVCLPRRARGLSEHGRAAHARRFSRLAGARAERRDDMGPRREEQRIRHRPVADDPRIEGTGVGPGGRSPSGRRRAAGEGARGHGLGAVRASCRGRSAGMRASCPRSSGRMRRASSSSTRGSACSRSRLRVGTRTRNVGSPTSRSPGHAMPSC